MEYCKSAVFISISIIYWKLFVFHPIETSMARTTWVVVYQWRAVIFQTSHAIGMPKPGYKIGFIQDQFSS